MEGARGAKVLRFAPASSNHDDGKPPARRSIPPQPTLDDAEILEALRRGDASAAAAFHDRVRPVIDRTLCRLIGRSDPDHEEVAQLSMIELVRSIERFRGECSIDTWTSRVTAHTAYKMLRRRKLERRFMESDSGGDDILDHRDLERDTAHRSVLERVRGHLGAIDEAKSWTLVLHDVCGYDLREIAHITEVSVSAAQTRLVRGRRELQERLQADPEVADLLRGRAPKGAS